MNILTSYQLSEIVFGSLFFALIALIGYYFINGELNLFDIGVMVIIYIMWVVLSYTFTNYIVLSS